MWETVKDFRLQLIDKENFKVVDMCDRNKLFIEAYDFEEYFKSQESMFDITASGPNFKTSVSDFVLETGAEMFIYLLNCPMSSSISWIFFYEDLCRSFKIG